MTTQNYSARVQWSPHRIDLSGAIFGAALTPLPELVAPTLERLPVDIGAALTREFWGQHDASTDWDGKHAAQDWLAAEVAKFEAEKVHRAFDEYEIRALALRWSDLCRRMVRLEVMENFARSVGIQPPQIKGALTRLGAAARMACPRWWRRQIRKHYTRRAEAHLRARGFVQKRREVYASDRAVANRRQRKARDRAMLQSMVAVSDAGDQLNLWEVVEKSQANPALRRAELMTRLRGFEEVAAAAGHVALFFTLTCPGAFHRTHASGEPNERWEGFSPRDGQAWLSKMWARARAKLARLSVMVYGFRIAEPHHDGTPHWHAVFFVASHRSADLQATIAGMWLSEYSAEPGANKYRSKCIPINPKKGSACGYVAKYVAKNIDGFEVGLDHETEKSQATESCARVAAWASAHSIRQFQQIGGPPVGVWREVRRLRDRAVSNETIEAARKAADAGQWADFITACGGIEAGRRCAVGLWAEHTGELNQYGELRGAQVVGVQALARAVVPVPLPSKARKRCRLVRRFAWADRVTARVRTREKVWRIKQKREGGAYRAGTAAAPSGSPSPLGPVSITVRDTGRVPPGKVAGGHASRSDIGAWMKQTTAPSRRDSDREWLAIIRGSQWTH